jgi:hypothetical protein
MRARREGNKNNQIYLLQDLLIVRSGNYCKGLAMHKEWTEHGYQQEHPTPRFQGKKHMG